MGSMAARWRGSAGDRLLVSGSLLVSSFPYFIVALLAWIYLYNEWGIFPASGYTPFTEDPAAWAAGLLLPWLVLGVTGSTNYARYGRTQMVESLGEDYVRSATAKGVSDEQDRLQARASRRHRPDCHDLRYRLRHPARPAP